MTAAGWRCVWMCRWCEMFIGKLWEVFWFWWGFGVERTNEVGNHGVGNGGVFLGGEGGHGNSKIVEKMHFCIRNGRKVNSRCHFSFLVWSIKLSNLFHGFPKFAIFRENVETNIRISSITGIGIKIWWISRKFQSSTSWGVSKMRRRKKRSMIEFFDMSAAVYKAINRVNKRSLLEY